MPATTPLILDSITDVQPAHAGRIAVSGSHGGHYPAAVASGAGLRAVAFNDAGLGLENAGVAGVEALADVGMAAIAIAASSAEIGSARDSLAHGRVSFVNSVAAKLGIAPGQQVPDIIDRLVQAPQPSGTLPAIPEARWDSQIGETPVLCVDSASLIQPGDVDRVIVTGSHGGLIGGDPARACKAAARLVAFNDAGGGKNDIGFSRLPALDQRGIAAVTLDCQTCRIGDAQSAVSNGIISRANTAASALNIREGMALAKGIAQLPSP